MWSRAIVRYSKERLVNSSVIQLVVAKYCDDDQFVTVLL